MRVRKMFVRALTVAAIGLGAFAGAAHAQVTVTVSPASNSLSFGVPTGSTMSAPQTVAISVGGSGSVTVSNITITPHAETVGGVSNGNTTPSNDFTETDTCGNNPTGSNSIAAPGSCAINVTFSATAPAGTLENATLTFTTSATDGAFNFALTGAAGAIRVFDPVYAAKSNPNASTSALVAFNSTMLALSCPVNPTATLSSSPDGSGYVLVDNFLTLNFGNTPPGTSTSNLSGNVCTGNPSDGGQPDCFTTNYQVPAGPGGLNGQDPDTFTNPGNSVLTTQGGNANNAGGVPPINVATQFASQSTTPTATVTMLDAGGIVASSTLFLVTQCSLVNANTGTETANPINNQPTQTLSFDTVQNHLDQYAFDYSFATAGGTLTNANSTPVVTNNSISPSAYSALVAGSPFQNTACIPLESLNGNCAIKTQVCPGPGGPSGTNCAQSTTPDILFTATFDPVNIITSNQINSNTSIPGFLEFSDMQNCPLEGPEANGPCPQNGLVNFSGPGENSNRRGAGSTNSSMIPVLGVTPPTTTVTVTPLFVNGSTNWTNASPQAAFTGVPGATSPTVAPIQFIEYGVNPSSEMPPLPPTFPLPFTGNSAFPTADTVFTDPTKCPSTYPATAPSFGPNTASLGPFGDNSSNVLHYSTTDCANTHELQFTDTAGSWSTSFKSITLTTDASAPLISITTPANGGSYNANQKVKANYSCVDTESGVATCAAPVANNSNIDTTPNGLTTTKMFAVNSTDNVGNASATDTVTYTVNCSYAAVTVSPSSVTRPAFVTIAASIMDCVSAPQNVKVKFALSGPIGKNCSPASETLFTTPMFTIKSGTSSSISFPFPILKAACPGTYAVTTTTLQGSSTIDTVTSSLTVN
jgi:hypothetical protein